MVLVGDVVFEVFQPLLEFFPLDVADVAKVLLVGVKLVCSFSKLPKGIEHKP